MKALLLTQCFVLVHVFLAGYVWASIPQGCQDTAVGIANSSIIPDNRFTASSYQDVVFVPRSARLNSVYFGWAPMTLNANEYLQIDMGKVFTICAVATQGSEFTPRWVTEYKISTSIDGVSWNVYTIDGNEKLFTGNTDGNTVVKNVLEPPARGRFIRFIPTAYNIYKILRVEAYGSPDQSACDSNPCLNGGTCHDLVNMTYRCECLSGYTGPHCQTNVTTRVTCGERYMQIDLNTVHFPDVDWRNLHLKDLSCRATKTNYTMNLRTPLDGCGTTYKENNNTIVFWNKVSSDGRGYGDGDQSLISRGKHIILRFYCKYNRNQLVSTRFKLPKKTVYASEGSYGNFKFTMDLYQSSQYQTPYSPFAYPVVVSPNQPLWVQYDVNNTNTDLVVFAETCRATTSNNPNSYPQHVFLQRGCVLDPTMVYSYDPHSRVQRFSIRSFRFVYSNTFLVYLHCELIVCHRNSTNSRCARGCISSRRRRETTDMDGSKVYDLSAGPLKEPNTKPGYDKQAGEGSSQANVPLIGGLAAAGGVFLLVAILLSVKILRNRKPAHVNIPPSTTKDVTVNSYEQQGVEQDEQFKTNA